MPLKKCLFDPRTVTGPIGMFHCPECGQMQLAGMKHVDFDSAEWDVIPLPEKSAEQPEQLPQDTD